MEEGLDRACKDLSRQLAEAEMVYGDCWLSTE